MNEAEEFLENNCLWINKRHWKHGEKKLYQIGAKTLEQYAQQVSRGAVTDYAKFINPDGYKRDIVIFNLGRLNHEQI